MLSGGRRVALTETDWFSRTDHGSSTNNNTRTGRWAAPARRPLAAGAVVQVAAAPDRHHRAPRRGLARSVLENEPRAAAGRLGLVARRPGLRHVPLRLVVVCLQRRHRPVQQPRGLVRRRRRRRR